MYNIKKAIYICIKIGMIIFAVDIIVFVLMVVLSMSDSRSPEIANVLFFILKNILSFPLLLLNNNLPFYLECRELPQYIFISVPINIILQSIFCFLIIKLFKWGIQTLNNK